MKEADMFVRIDVSEFERYIKDKGDFGAFIRRGLERTGDAGEVIMIRHAPKDRGAGGGLVSSISAKLERGQVEVAPRMRHIYPKVMITGTRPFRPPWGPIETWARRKGLPAGPIWMGIRKRGIQSADRSKYRVDYAQETRKELNVLTPKIFNDEMKDWIRM